MVSSEHTLVMFPGQGSQKVGMAQLILREFPAVKPLFEEAEDTLKQPLMRIMAEGPPARLAHTRYAQPCVFVVALAYHRVLQAETGLSSLYYAGHSLGEITALVAAGKLAPTVALQLVAARAHAMAAAFPTEHAAMAAIMPMSEAAVRHLLVECNRVLAQAAPMQVRAGAELFHSLDISAINSTGQVVVAGSKHGLAVLQAMLNDPESRAVAGARRIKVRPLAVSAPFHSRYMEPARRMLTEPFEAAALQDSPARIIANVSGEVAHTYSAEHLLRQLTSPVRWHETLLTARAVGVRRFIALSHSSVLMRMWMAEDCFQSGAATMLSTADLKAAIKMISKAVAG